MKAAVTALSLALVLVSEGCQPEGQPPSQQLPDGRVVDVGWNGLVGELCVTPDNPTIALAKAPALKKEGRELYCGSSNASAHPWEQNFPPKAARSCNVGDRYPSCRFNKEVR